MKQNYELKPLFVERMKSLLGKAEYERYKKSIESAPLRSIRVNTLKISEENLKKRLEKKSWIVKQPFEDYPEIMIILGKFVNENLEDENEKKLLVKSLAGEEGDKRAENERKITDLEPGELGRALEHLLGYYYIQEISSMLPAIALNPKQGEIVLDLCAAPGSKTTQMASMMNNQGVLIANDTSFSRIKILASNLERCGVTNAIIIKKEGVALCKKIKSSDFLLDKILVDAPCSGEGTIISNRKTSLMWNINTVKSLSKMQKKLLESAIEILKIGGEIVYSTCTHAPEENEEVLDYILKKFDNLKMEKINLPIKCAQGVLKWADENYNKEVEKSCRIYPHVTGMEGFFIAKMRKTK